MICSTCATGLSPLNNCTSNMNTVCVDNTPPVITLFGPTNLTVEAGSNVYKELGFYAVDSYDGNITSKVRVSPLPIIMTISSYSINYTVSDAAGNFAIVKTRIVHINDTTPPLITL